jgi:hypothetical protein
VDDTNPIPCGYDSSNASRDQERHTRGSHTLPWEELCSKFRVVLLG